MFYGLKKLLTKHEGKFDTVYKCPAGKHTIGVGHNVDANGLPENIQTYLDENGYITDEMIDFLLEMDIAIAADDCRDLYPSFDSFTDNRQMALIDFLFNVGRSTASTFKNTNRAINEERWDDAANNFEKSLWYKQVKNRAKEIVGMIRNG